MICVYLCLFALQYIKKYGHQLKFPVSKLLPANPDILEGVIDLTQLSYLNEPSVLYNLGCRYSQDKIYVRLQHYILTQRPRCDSPFQVLLIPCFLITMYPKRLELDRFWLQLIHSRNSHYIQKTLSNLMVQKLKTTMSHMYIQQWQVLSKQWCKVCLYIMCRTIW